jgi:hypothetical protein
MAKAPLKQWTAKEIEDAFGSIIHQDFQVVVRAKYSEPGFFCLYVHRINENGNEETPRGYLLGTNYLELAL